MRSRSPLPQDSHSAARGGSLPGGGGGRVELRARLRPGDGPADLAEALAWLRWAGAAGFRLLFFDPGAADEEEAGRWLARLQVAAEALAPALEVRAARWLPLPRAARLERRELARVALGGGRLLPLELPFSHDLKAPARLVGDLRRAGWEPLLFAPELHPEVQRQAELSRYLLQAGGWLVLDAGSLAGRNGHGARVAALRLVRLGWYSFCAGFLAHPGGPVAPEEVLELLRRAPRRRPWRPGEAEALVEGRLGRAFGAFGPFGGPGGHPALPP